MEEKCVFHSVPFIIYLKKTRGNHNIQYEKQMTWVYIDLGTLCSQIYNSWGYVVRRNLI